jgi:hypothetical protein
MKLHNLLHLDSSKMQFNINNNYIGKTARQTFCFSSETM